MDGQFSFKDFENVYLKATYNMKIGNREFSPNEVITVFDKIQIAGLADVTDVRSARGGFGNRARVYWQTVQEQNLQFAQGVMSKYQFALMANSFMFDKTDLPAVGITTTEYHEISEQNTITLEHKPCKDLYIYKKETGEKITDYSIDESLITFTDMAYTEVVVNYIYDYTNATELFRLGRALINGFVSLEGRTRIKDDTTGLVKTGILYIPHLKLTSDLSIRLGAQANPIVANFSAIGVPVGSRNETYVSEFCILGDDLSSDF